MASHVFRAAFRRVASVPLPSLAPWSTRRAVQVPTGAYACAVAAAVGVGTGVACCVGEEGAGDAAGPPPPWITADDLELMLKFNNWSMRCHPDSHGFTDLVKEERAYKQRRARAAAGDKAPRLVIFGPPGAGKGTQCAKITQRFGVVHISTGDMFRAAVASGSPIGQIAKSYMDDGKLCPPSIGHDMLKERLQQADVRRSGYILDGFPREAANSEFLVREGETPDAIIVLDVPQDELVRRLSGRRFDPVTRRTYHMVFAPPPADDAALLARLTRRTDDSPEIAQRRIAAYDARVKECLEPFPASCVVTVDGTGTVDEVFARVAAAVRGRHQCACCLVAELRHVGTDHRVELGGAQTWAAAAAAP